MYSSESITFLLDTTKKGLSDIWAFEERDIRLLLADRTLIELSCTWFCMLTGINSTVTIVNLHHALLIIGDIPVEGKSFLTIAIPESYVKMIVEESLIKRPLLNGLLNRLPIAHFPPPMRTLTVLDANLTLLASYPQNFSTSSVISGNVAILNFLAMLKGLNLPHKPKTTTKLIDMNMNALLIMNQDLVFLVTEPVFF